jgi:hypothetical protein
MPSTLLNESPSITRQHYKILLMSWAGWVFDFADPEHSDGFGLQPPAHRSLGLDIP